MHRKSIKEINNDLKAKKYSVKELVQHFVDRIEKYGDGLNALISFCKDTALKQSDSYDISKSDSKIYGLPIIHKDVLCTKGIKTTCGSRMLDNFIAPYDATVVEKMQKSGAITLGKANMDEFAMGSSTENSFYGVTPNPWNLEYVSGGSSGGSAALVAAGLIPATTGTDTGGSIRQPASFCGISGIKPTYGRVSRFGLVAYASSLDQAGPMARSVEDLAYLLNSMAGHDPKDSTSVNNSVPDYLSNLNHKLQGKTIGLPKKFMEEGLNSDIVKKMEVFIDELSKLGVKVIDIDLPNANLSVPAYYIIACSECSSNLARFDGIRYGYKHPNPSNLLDQYIKSRGTGFGREVKRRIMLGTYTLSAGYYDAYYLKAQKIRRIIKNDYLKAFDKVDAIILPTSPTTAFKIGEKINDPISMYLSDIYTVGINLAGLPSLSVPIGFINNLPLGAQIIGKHFDESTILNIGHQYQLATDWHKQFPENYT